MTILAAILKGVGIALLVLLALVLVVLLLVLLVPFRYSVRGHVRDPEEHGEVPFQVWKENAAVSAEVTWLLHLIKAKFLFPAADKLEVRILGRKFPLERFMKKEEAEEEQEEEQEQEEEEKKSLSEKLLSLEENIDTAGYGINYYQRTLTGPCGRHAIDAALPRLGRILQSIAPGKWFLKGAVGLGDPYMSGKVCEACSILYPFAEERLEVETVWDAYRLDLDGELEGGLRLGTIVANTVPLLLNKNCRKLVKKLRAGKAKIKAYRSQLENTKDGGQNGGAEQ